MARARRRPDPGEPEQVVAGQPLRGADHRVPDPDVDVELGVSLSEEDRLAREPAPALRGVRELLLRRPDPEGEVVPGVEVDGRLEEIPHRGRYRPGTGDERDGEVDVLRGPGPGAEAEVHREAAFEEPPRLLLPEQAGEEAFEDELQLEGAERDAERFGPCPEVRLERRLERGGRAELFRHGGPSP